MQKWLKFQYQSRDLQKKLLFILFTVGLFSFSPQIFAQEDLGLLVEQQKIIFEVGRHSDVHVKHVVETGVWGPDRPRIIEILPGAHSNILVTDEDGDLLNFSYDAETFEESKYIVLNQKSGNYDLIAEYDLDEFMKLEDGIWKKELEFTHDVIVMIDEDINYIFSNSRPIMMNDAKGINCMGCNMSLEFFADEKIHVKEILFNEKKNEIKYLSNKKISDLEFNQNLINLNVSDDDQLTIIQIPLELLLNPFSVFFTEKQDTSLDQIDKIRKTEFNQDETHVNVSFRTMNEGIVSIVGAEFEEHQKVLEQIEKRKNAEVKSSQVNEKSGVAIPVPGTSAYEEMEKSETAVLEKDTLSFADDLEKSTNDNLQDYTVIAIIIGIAATIIIGIIVKVKKN